MDAFTRTIQGKKRGSMKLTRKDFCVWKNDICIIPTFRTLIDNQIYQNHNFSIEFHWLVFHARLLFEQAESEDEKK